MSCSGRNSPSGSHQRWASWLNFSSSAGSAFTMPIVPKKNPAGAGFLSTGEADQFLRVPMTSISTRRSGCRHLISAACRAVLHLSPRRAASRPCPRCRRGCLDALRHQVGLDRLGAAHRQRLVVGVGADRVGVADRDHHFEVDAADLVRQVVELRLALGLDHRLVEVEQHVGGEGDLLGDGLRLRRLRRGLRRPARAPGRARAAGAGGRGRCFLRSRNRRRMRAPRASSQVFLFIICSSHAYLKTYSDQESA